MLVCLGISRWWVGEEGGNLITVMAHLVVSLVQLCVAAVDEAKCQPVNSWRDEDQEVGKVCRGSR